MSKSALAKLVSPEEDDSSVGNLLLRMGAITPSMLSRAILVQSQLGDIFLGRVLIELGMIGERELKRALELQDRMRASSGNGDWVESLLDAMDDNVDENLKQVNRLKSALDALGIYDD